MNTYWFYYRDSTGNQQIGYIQANDPHSATRQAKAMYGQNMMSEAVGHMPQGRP